MTKHKLPKTLLRLTRMYGDLLERKHHGPLNELGMPDFHEGHFLYAVERAIAKKTDEIQAVRLAKGRPRCRYDDEVKA